MSNLVTEISRPVEAGNGWEDVYVNLKQRDLIKASDKEMIKRYVLGVNWKTLAGFKRKMAP